MEVLKHECGIAMIRLRKPLDYYIKKYGTSMYGLNKLYLLMEKQHNRGQEGAGLACVSMQSKPGHEYMFRERALGSNAISEIFKNVRQAIANSDDANPEDGNVPFIGELYMGHLRYSTTGKSGINYVHPLSRRNNWRSRSLLLCGNFNMTNVDEIFKAIVNQGQHPRFYSDTFIILEQLGLALDTTNQKLYDKYKAQGLEGIDLTNKIEQSLDFKDVLSKSAKTWDGGYAMCGMTGSGDLFVLRDPHGIRPAFYYYDDEIFVAASERPVIQTTIDVARRDVHELEPGSAIMVNQKGEIKIEQILPQLSNERCSFERIYFSRGSDADIYKERKQLGRTLAEPILKAVDYDFAHTIFSFIPNTAEMAYIGMIEGINDIMADFKAQAIMKLDTASGDYGKQLREILGRRLRIEKIAIKDIKLRTFITEGKSRNDLAAHVYDVTYGQVQNHVDNLVVIDDSIVRGTTLKQSIIRILDRLHPKKIIIVSSSPQVRYPDYYGIDMSRMNEFCAFKAAIALLRETGRSAIIDEVYKLSKAQENLPKEECVNYVKKIYEPFTDEDISRKIAAMITDADISAEISIIYQTLDGLHESIPNNPGDWYFSGNYPTPGGNKMVSKAFVNWYEGNTLKR